MFIKANTLMMLFRFSNFKGYNFIKEHQKVLSKRGKVWLLKIGRKAVNAKMKRIQEEGGFIILKTPKKEGEDYFVAHFSELGEVANVSSSLYPAYYKEMDSEGGQLRKEGQWFLVDEIKKIDQDLAEDLYLYTNNKQVIEVVRQTRTATMFVFNKTNWNV